MLTDVSGKFYQYRQSRKRRHIFSYGGGVQSFTVLALIADGRLPVPDVIAYSDMSPFEAETLEFTQTHGRAMAARFDMDITIITPEKVLEVELMKGYVITPFWYRGEDGKPALQARRSCTFQTKVQTINDLIGRRMTDAVWLGLSADELRRVRGDEDELTWGRIRENRYPLIELDMSRADCVEYLEAHDYPVPERSSCDMCPFSSRKRLLLMLARNTGTYERIQRIEAAWHKSPKNSHKYLTRFLDKLPTPEEAAAILWTIENEIDNSGTCGVCEF